MGLPAHADPPALSSSQLTRLATPRVAFEAPRAEDLIAVGNLDPQRAMWSEGPANLVPVSWTVGRESDMSFLGLNHHILGSLCYSRSACPNYYHLQEQTSGLGRSGCPGLSRIWVCTQAGHTQVTGLPAGHRKQKVLTGQWEAGVRAHWPRSGHAMTPWWLPTLRPCDTLAMSRPAGGWVLALWLLQLRFPPKHPGHPPLCLPHTQDLDSPLSALQSGQSLTPFPPEPL